MWGGWYSQWVKQKVTLQRTKLISMYSIMESEAKEFLDSMSRNSKSTQKTYASGLLLFRNFLDTKRHTLSSIIPTLKANEVDVYYLLDQFVSYLVKSKHYATGKPLALRTIDNYMVAVKSYLEYNDIDIIPKKFKRKVKMPRVYEEDEEAIDASDIRSIMLSCNNRRLKPYLLTLASGGMRASEACAIRLCDLNFDVHPTKVHIRKEYAKTRVARDVYISDEATKFLKEWIDWKYRERKHPHKWGEPIVQPVRKEEDLVFTHYKQIVDARAIYPKIRNEFVKLLETVGFAKRKEGIQRRVITLHSFRRYVKTVISDQVSKDYSEWFLGHSKSPYYTMKEPMRRDIYREKCMRFLTFLDYDVLESQGKSTEARLESSQKEIEQLKKQLQSKNWDMDQLRKEMQEQLEIVKQNVIKSVSERLGLSNS